MSPPRPPSDFELTPARTTAEYTRELELRCERQDIEIEALWLRINELESAAFSLEIKRNQLRFLLDSERSKNKRLANDVCRLAAEVRRLSVPR